MGHNRLGRSGQPDALRAYIFQKLFGYSKAKATELMLKVHQEGKAVVSSGSRDKMEHDVRRLHAAGLWATMQRDS